MNTSKSVATDFKIVWNNFGVNTVCPLCGDRTEPSINFQVQTSDGEAICETCLIEEATDLAEVLYAYFAYKYPEDNMTKLFLEEIKKEQVRKQTKPRVVDRDILRDIQELTGAIALHTSVTNDSGNLNSMFLITRKWFSVNYPIFMERFNGENNKFPTIEPQSLSFSEKAEVNALYLKALEEGAIIAEYHY